VELLSQPFFFFCTRNDLSFNDVLSKNAGNAVSQEELDQRDPNGDVDIANVEILWTPLDREQLPQSSPTLELGQEHPPSSSSSSSSSTLPALDLNQQQSPAALPRLEYDDTWTANGEEIDDARKYLESELYSSLVDRYHHIIPGVILSINERQEPLGGFSVIVDRHVLRPGRTLITTLNHPRGDHHVLLVFRLSAYRNITLHVLDAMAWQTTKEHRQAIHEAALQLLIDSKWWRHTFTSIDNMTAQFPQHSLWINCAQHDVQSKVDTLTILNGLALALGLELDETYNEHDGPATFHDQAQLIFESALNNRLDWKLLYAFLISAKYVKQPKALAAEGPGVTNTHHMDKAMLPPQNRRFNLRVRSYHDLVTQQRTRDRDSSVTRKAMDMKFAADQTKLLLRTGQAHDIDFPSDEWPADFLQTVAREVTLRGAWKLSSTKEQVESYFREMNQPGTAVDGGLLPVNEAIPAHRGVSPKGVAATDAVSSKGDSSKPSETLQKQTSNNPFVDSGVKPAPLSKPGPTGSTVTPTIPKVIPPGSSIDHADIPGDFDACGTFRRLIQKHLDDKKGETDLRDFRERSRVTMQRAVWLEDEEVHLAVAAVTLAISRDQGVANGIGYISQPNVQLYENVNHEYPARMVRPGRPVLLPLPIEQHFILLIIHLNDNGDPQFSVMDSRGFHLNKEQRQRVHAWASSIVSNSLWGSHFTSEARQPRHTIWIPASQQPSSSECGYYTILNAWSLALGLEPDPDADINWNDQSFEDLQNIVHLARMGKADWMMIYAFLRCRGFVRDGIVPMDRRFTRTEELRNPSDIYLDPKIEKLSKQDDWYFKTKNMKLDRRAVARATRLRLPTGGRKHTEVFPSDSWDEVDKMDADDLLRRGQYILDYDASQLKAAHAAIKSARAHEFHYWLLKKYGEYSSVERDKLGQDCRKYLQEWHSERELSRRPFCVIAEDTTNFYECLIYESIMGAGFATNAIEEGKWPRGLTQSEVNLSLSAVVEAIDRLQHEIHRKQSTTYPGHNPAPFAGGLSLSTSFGNDMTLLSPDPVKYIASRSRRCFLMPLCLGAHATRLLNEERQKEGLDPMRVLETVGHHLLTVVQEDPQTGEFQVIFYDSSEHIFRDSMPFLVNMVQSAVTKLQWPTHRNADSNWTLKRALPLIDIPQQPRKGRWQCGPRTVINGWILAMGLTPNLEAVDRGDTACHEFLYLAEAAVAGILNWTALAAWFFCHNLTIERGYEEVPENRRFTFTRVWNDESELSTCIKKLRADDDRLATLSEHQLPYDYGNNTSWQEYEEPEIEVSRIQEEDEHVQVENSGKGDITNDDAEGDDIGNEEMQDDGVVKEDAEGDIIEDNHVGDMWVTDEDAEGDEDDEMSGSGNAVGDYSYNSLFDGEDDEESDGTAKDRQTGVGDESFDSLFDERDGLARRVEEPDSIYDAGFKHGHRVAREASVVDTLSFLDGYHPSSRADRYWSRKTQRTPGAVNHGEDALTFLDGY
jgi:hypothetical protein